MLAQPAIRPETPSFLEPLMNNLLSLLICVAGGVILGSILGYTIRRAIYAGEGYGSIPLRTWLIIAAVIALVIIVWGILLGTIVAGGLAAFVYAAGTLVGTVSFAQTRRWRRW
jgi:ABC-type sugar transport system permease subunit